ncbi:MAG: sulfite exporter TauE/SafE family protein [Armatimonadetes bacterium]|nr:sulfite exporter TauE/SafE family protein [Armatimonadota bacterium]
METLGYIASALIGLSLGLIGGGGSTLTVPVLVYLFSIPATQATGYSLFVVGVTSVVGAYFAARRGHVEIRTGALFALPALVSVYLVRRLVVPALPDTLFSIGATGVTRDAAILVLFGTLMLFAAVAMIRPRMTESEKENGHAWKLAVKGALIGLITGLVGAGGGFLIVPALVFFAKLPMKTAVGTSLSIIALNSLVGFVGEVQATNDIAWALLGTVTTIAVAGIVVGGMIGKKISGAKLKPAFGWFVLTMGVFLVGNTLLAAPK